MKDKICEVDLCNLPRKYEVYCNVSYYDHKDKDHKISYKIKLSAYNLDEALKQAEIHIKNRLWRKSIGDLNIEHFKMSGAPINSGAFGIEILKGEKNGG